MNDDISLEGIAGQETAQTLSVRHFSLMNSLLTVINTTPRNNPDHVIARFFLDHFDHLADLNVYEVAQACYTSRSGLRRFCQSIGFENFSSIKRSAFEWRRHYDYFTGYVNHDNFRAHMAASLASMVATIDKLVTDEDLNALVNVLHDARTVLLVASDFSSMAVRDFQQAMLVMHKVVYLVTDSVGDEAMFASLGPSDVVLVISATGNYAQVSRQQIEQTGALRVLVTFNRDQHLAEPYEVVLYLSDEDLGRSRSVYAKYGVNYLFDLLYNRYFTRFGS